MRHALRANQTKKSGLHWTLLLRQITSAYLSVHHRKRRCFFFWKNRSLNVSQLNANQNHAMKLHRQIMSCRIHSDKKSVRNTDMFQSPEKECWVCRWVQTFLNGRRLIFLVNCARKLQAHTFFSSHNWPHFFHWIKSSHVNRKSSLSSTITNFHKHKTKKRW